MDDRNVSAKQQPRSVTVLLGAALLAGCGGDGGGSSRGEPDAPASTEAASARTTAGSCSWEVVERRPLVLPDGRHAYVEPTNLMRVRDDLVVAGAPTYTWDVGGTRVDMLSEGAHVAAYLDEEAPRLVENPIEGSVGVVRSVVLDAPRWGALLEERGPSRDSRDFVALWYAEYDGASWSEPERLPVPPDGRLFLGSSSALTMHGGAPTWVVVHNPEGAVLQYERRDGAWSYRSIAAEGVEAAAMAVGPSDTWLALSGLDPGIPGPIKSVRLFRWDDGWQLVSRNPTAEPYTEVPSMSVLALVDGAALTWMELGSSTTVMARIGVAPDRPGRLIVVDESAAVVRPFVTDEAEPAWVVHHVNDITGAEDLRLLLPEGLGVVTALSVPYPYTGFYAPIAVAPGEVLVTGAEFSPDPARPTVRSLTLRLSSSCQ